MRATLVPLGARAPAPESPAEAVVRAHLPQVDRGPRRHLEARRAPAPHPRANLVDGVPAKNRWKGLDRFQARTPVELRRAFNVVRTAAMSDFATVLVHGGDARTGHAEARIVGKARDDVG